MVTNKIALVTRGSQGIGKAISEKLLAAGAAVAIAALEDNRLQETAAEFESKKLRFKCYGADLAEELQIDSLVKCVIRDFGPVDILINNAGIPAPTLPAHEISTNDWDRTLGINLRTAFLL